MKKATTATLALLAMTAAAYADSVEMRFVGSGQGRAVKVQINGVQQNLHAGQLNHEILSRSGPTAPAVGALVTYCVDIYEFVSTQSQTYQVAELTDAPVAPGNTGMAQHQADAIGRLYTYANGQQYGTNNNFAAAFQIAIWEIVADMDTESSTLSVASGDFRAFNLNSGTTSYLNTLLAVATDTTIAPLANLRALTNDGAQDQLFDSVVIPLPGAAGLAAVGLAGVGFMARRRRL